MPGATIQEIIDVIVRPTGITQTSKGLVELNQNAKGVTSGLKGMTGATINSTKAFSRMTSLINSQVAGTYATVAANIFAVSAAARSLENAFNIANMKQAADVLGQQLGVNLRTVTEELRAATGGLLTFQDAMSTANLASAAGVTSDQLSRLTKVAKGAAITLGRDMTDSINRLLRGSIKMETEILDELGIFVRLDDAVKAYAESVGKAADQVTQFEKVQAFTNAALTQGEKKYGEVTTALEGAENKVTKLITAIRDASHAILESVANLEWLNKGLDSLSSNMEGIQIAILAIAAAISGRLIAGLGTALAAIGLGFQNLITKANAGTVALENYKKQTEILTTAEKLRTEQQNRKLTSDEKALVREAQKIEKAQMSLEVSRKQDAQLQSVSGSAAKAVKATGKVVEKIASAIPVLSQVIFLATAAFAAWELFFKQGPSEAEKQIASFRKETEATVKNIDEFTKNNGKSIKALQQKAGILETLQKELDKTKGKNKEYRDEVVKTTKSLAEMVGVKFDKDSTVEEMSKQLKNLSISSRNAYSEVTAFTDVTIISDDKLAKVKSLSRLMEELGKHAEGSSKIIKGLLTQTLEGIEDVNNKEAELQKLAASPILSFGQADITNVAKTYLDFLKSTQGESDKLLDTYRNIDVAVRKPLLFATEQLNRLTIEYNEVLKRTGEFGSAELDTARQRMVAARALVDIEIDRLSVLIKQDGATAQLRQQAQSRLIELKQEQQFLEDSLELTQLQAKDRLEDFRDRTEAVDRLISKQKVLQKLDIPTTDDDFANRLNTRSRLLDTIREQVSEIEDIGRKQELTDGQQSELAILRSKLREQESAAASDLKEELASIVSLNKQQVKDSTSITQLDKFRVTTSSQILNSIKEATKTLPVLVGHEDTLLRKELERLGFARAYDAIYKEQLKTFETEIEFQEELLRIQLERAEAQALNNTRSAEYAATVEQARDSLAQSDTLGTIDGLEPFEVVGLESFDELRTTMIEINSLATKFEMDQLSINKQIDERVRLLATSTNLSNKERANITKEITSLGKKHAINKENFETELAASSIKKEDLKLQTKLEAIEKKRLKNSEELAKNFERLSSSIDLVASAFENIGFIGELSQDMQIFKEVGKQSADSFLAFAEATSASESAQLELSSALAERRDLLGAGKQDTIEYAKAQERVEKAQLESADAQKAAFAAAAGGIAAVASVAAQSAEEGSGAQKLLAIAGAAATIANAATTTPYPANLAAIAATIASLQPVLAMVGESGPRTATAETVAQDIAESGKPGAVGTAAALLSGLDTDKLANILDDIHSVMRENTYLTSVIADNTSRIDSITETIEGIGAELQVADVLPDNFLQGIAATISGINLQAITAEQILAPDRQTPGEVDITLGTAEGVIDLGEAGTVLEQYRRKLRGATEEYFDSMALLISETSNELPDMFNIDMTTNEIADAFRQASLEISTKAFDITTEAGREAFNAALIGSVSQTLAETNPILEQIRKSGESALEAYLRIVKGYEVLTQIGTAYGRDVSETVNATIARFTMRLEESGRDISDAETQEEIEQFQAALTRVNLAVAERLEEDATHLIDGIQGLLSESERAALAITQRIDDAQGFLKGIQDTTAISIIPEFEGRLTDAAEVQTFITEAQTEALDKINNLLAVGTITEETAINLQANVIRYTAEVGHAAQLMADKVDEINSILGLEDYTETELSTRDFASSVIAAGGSAEILKERMLETAKDQLNLAFATGESAEEIALLEAQLQFASEELVEYINVTEQAKRAFSDIPESIANFQQVTENLSTEAMRYLIPALDAIASSGGLTLDSLNAILATSYSNLQEATDITTAEFNDIATILMNDLEPIMQEYANAHKDAISAMLGMSNAMEDWNLRILNLRADIGDITYQELAGEYSNLAQQSIDAASRFVEEGLTDLAASTFDRAISQLEGALDAEIAGINKYYDSLEKQNEKEASAAKSAAEAQIAANEALIDVLKDLAERWREVSIMATDAITGMLTDVTAVQNPQRALEFVGDQIASIDYTSSPEAAQEYIELLTRRLDIAREVYQAPEQALKAIEETTLAELFEVQQFAKKQVDPLEKQIAQLEETNKNLALILGAIDNTANIEDTARQDAIDVAMRQHIAELEKLTALKEAIEGQKAEEQIKSLYNIEAGILALGVSLTGNNTLFADMFGELSTSLSEQREARLLAQASSLEATTTETAAVTTVSPDRLQTLGDKVIAQDTAIIKNATEITSENSVLQVTAQEATNNLLSSIFTRLEYTNRILTDGFNVVTASISGLINRRFSVYDWDVNQSAQLIGSKIDNLGRALAPETYASNAIGMDYVPYDGYLTRLHKGEKVINAESARRDGDININVSIDGNTTSDVGEQVVDAIVRNITTIKRELEYV